MLTAGNIINNNVLAQFSNLILNDRLAHAYLFIGPEGVGKRETAIGIAKLVNCEDVDSVQKGYFCDKCASCVKINTGNHPDINIVDSSFDEPIKISSSRAIIEKIKLKPFMARRKVFILNNIENLTDEAANTLLKTLEEPTDNSLILLTTNMLERNLSTVISRCQKIYILPCTRRNIKDSFINKYSGNDADMQFLAYFSEGCLGKANALKQEDIISEKNEMIDYFIYSKNANDYIKDISKNKNKSKMLIKVLIGLIRDAMFFKIENNDNRMINMDRKEEIGHLASSYSFFELNNIYKEIISASKMLEENLNVKISLMIIKEML